MTPPRVTGIALVHQLVRDGRLTPAQGAELLELRRRLVREMERPRIVRLVRGLAAWAREKWDRR